MAQRGQNQGAAGAAPVGGGVAAGVGAAALGGVPAAGAAPARAGGAVARTAVMPETFDGEGDWQEYLAYRYFIQCAEVNGWQDPQRAQFLGVRLRDAARRFFTTLPAARRVNWQHLCADMGNRFAPAAVANQYKAQFRTRRQKAGEDLLRVADDLRRLVVRAYPMMPDAVRDDLVRDQFIESLTPVALRVRLQENPPATVHAEVENALHLEKVWSEVELPPDASTKLVGPYVGAGLGAVAQPLLQTVMATSGVCQSPRYGPASMVAPVSQDEQLATLATSLSQLTEKLDQVLHQESTCPAPGIFQSPRRGWRPPNSRGGGSPLLCWHCNRPWHTRAQCPELASRDSGRNGRNGSAGRGRPQHQSGNEY